MKIFETEHVHISMACSAEKVYEFVSNPEHLPQWASGLAGTIKQDSHGDWLAESPLGKVKVKFAPQNHFGVLDHDVVLDSGERFHNPMRVLPNGEGSEIIFTLFKLPDVSDEKFREDAAWVKKDLNRLKQLLEI